LGKFLPTIPLEYRAAILRDLFGARGAGFASVLSDPKVLQQMGNLRKDMPGLRSVTRPIWRIYLMNPLMQMQSTRNDLKNTLANISERLMPALIGALQPWTRSISCCRRAAWTA
jgi:hypothetical protein